MGGSTPLQTQTHHSIQVSYPLKQPYRFVEKQGRQEIVEHLSYFRVVVDVVLVALYQLILLYLSEYSVSGRIWLPF